MTSGTKSYLIGCHQFLLHPLWVLLAWLDTYKSWPTWREFVCMLIHDVGVCGRDYLKGNNKEGHGELGAFWAYKLFGMEYGLFCLGHSDEELLECEYKDTDIRAARSKLFIPDKLSFLYAPLWWLKFVQQVEGFNKVCTAEQFLDKIRKNRDDGFPVGSNHQHYKDFAGIK